MSLTDIVRKWSRPLTFGLALTASSLYVVGCGKEDFDECDTGECCNEIYKDCVDDCASGDKEACSDKACDPHLYRSCVGRTSGTSGGSGYRRSGESGGSGGSGGSSGGAGSDPSSSGGTYRCEDECSPHGSLKCVDTAMYTCLQEERSNGCLYWAKGKDCRDLGGGSRCVVGENNSYLTCSEPPAPHNDDEGNGDDGGGGSNDGNGNGGRNDCEDSCSPFGKEKCVGSTFYSCGIEPPVECLKWVKQTDCQEFCNSNGYSNYRCQGEDTEESSAGCHCWHY